MASKRSRQIYEEDLTKQASPFVIYGTPLPPLDDDARDDGSYVPVWKQEVTDERGRKRLHGAFTGGFSAGYFNTVGSKEGWTPSTFVSSRSNRAKDQSKASQQRPEDFMDEEDVREQEESRQLSTTSEFAGFGTESDSMRQNALMDLFRPVESSIGNKLLAKMGWKPGQGIGPRVKRRADNDDGDGAQPHMFAPEDVPMILLNHKNDTKGLGYLHEGETLGNSSLPHTSKNQKSAVESDEDDDKRPGLSFMNSKKKSVVKSNKSGFGVGILNDTGSDEEDPYSMGPRISYNKTIGAEKKAKKKANASFGAANPLLRVKPTFVSKKLSTMQNALRKCHDGRLPLAGFVLGDELESFSSMSLADDKYKPLEVPADWKPANAPELENVSDSSRNYQSTAEVAKQSSYTSATRGVLLGEEKLPGKSVFDFLTPAAREKLIKATGRRDLPPALSEHLAGSEAGASGAGEASSVEIPYLDVVTAKSALSRAESGGFIPYAEDLDKRARYKRFLEIAAGDLPEGTQPIKPAHNTRDEDWTNEMNEFVRAAEVFRPMTGAIASRFTSSSSSLNNNSATTDSQIADAIGKGGENGTDNLVRKPTSKPEDPAEVAAKLGMFGVMTRSISSFQPTKLVCKRFGVDMPLYVPQDISQPAFPESFHQHAKFAATAPPASADIVMAPPSSEGPKLSTETDRMQQDRGIHAAQQQHQQKKSHNDTMSNEISITDDILQNQASSSINPDRNEALEQARPGQDVFRAIFGDSDSDTDTDG